MFDLPHNFGDYTLVALVGRTRGGILYQAIQQGMDRSVFMELLVPDNPEGVTVEDFIMKAIKSIREFFKEYYKSFSASYQG